MIIIAIIVFLACVLDNAGRQAKGRQAGRQAIQSPAMPKPIKATKPKPIIDYSSQIDALQVQLDAICEHALALDKAADAQNDPVKKASFISRSAGTYARAAAIQAKIDRLIAS